MSVVPINYQDDITLIETTQDGYGDNSISHVEKLKGLFNSGTSQAETGYVEGLSSDANVYLDKDNAFVQSACMRLEGMYIVANPFGFKDSESWYKISSVEIGQDKLLSNSVDNVHCYLTKCDALADLDGDGESRGEDDEQSDGGE